MGSNNSIAQNERNNSLLSFEEDLLDYNGIKTSEENLEENDTGYEDSDLYSTNVKNNSKIETNKVPVTFEWESGGNSVYLSGNFCNWEQYFLMEKQPNGKHTLTLYLNKGFIQYKFKVDNIWKYNENFPTTIDHGYKNNYIDTTNWEISAEKSEETTNSTTELSFKQSDNKSINLNTEFQNSQNNYGNYFPKLEEMNDNALKTPEQYKNKINFDKNIRKSKSKIKNLNYISNNEENKFGENYSYKKIRPVNHELINHMNYKIKNNKNVKIEEKNPTICSIVARYRLKFTTFVYYKNK